MARKKLSPGYHNVKMKQKGGKTVTRRVQVLKNGQWKFLKSGSKKGSKKSPSKKSGSKKGSKKKKSKSKSNKSSNPGGKKMGKASRLSPVNKNGIKVPTLLIEGGLVLAALEDPDGGERGAYYHASNKNYTRAMTEYGRCVNPLGETMAGKAIRWGAGLRIIRGFVSNTPIQIGPLIF